MVCRAHGFGVSAVYKVVSAGRANPLIAETKSHVFITKIAQHRDPWLEPPFDFIFALRVGFPLAVGVQMPHSDAPAPVIRFWIYAVRSSTIRQADRRTHEKLLRESAVRAASLSHSPCHRYLPEKGSAPWVVERHALRGMVCLNRGGICSAPEPQKIKVYDQGSGFFSVA